MMSRLQKGKEVVPPADISIHLEAFCFLEEVIG